MSRHHPGALALFGLLLAAGAGCGDSELAQTQYVDGREQARAQGCSCDPFLGDPALQRAADTSQHWEQGYVNTCVDVRRDCPAQE